MRDELMDSRIPYLLGVVMLFVVVGAGGLANGLRRAWKAGRAGPSGVDLGRALQAAGSRTLSSLLIAAIPLVLVVLVGWQRYLLLSVGMGLAAFVVFLLVRPPQLGLEYQWNSALAAGGFFLVMGISLGGHFFQVGNPAAAVLAGIIPGAMGVLMLVSALYSLIAGRDE